MDYQSRQIARSIIMLRTSFQTLKYHRAYKSIFNILQEELDFLSYDDKAKQHLPPPYQKCKCVLSTQQYNIIFRALLGAERLAYLIRIKKVPLLLSERQDLDLICLHSTQSIELLETLKDNSEL